MLKFRTMVVDGTLLTEEQRAVSDGTSSWSTIAVTAWAAGCAGRARRAPQLLNCCGEMSIVVLAEAAGGDRRWGSEPGAPRRAPRIPAVAVLRETAASDETMQRLDLEYVRTRSWSSICRPDPNPLAMLRSVDD